MIEIRKITVAELLEHKDWNAVVEKYADESSIKDMPRFKVDVALYKKLESFGSLSVFGAFSGELLVGFLSVLVTVLPHYSTETAKIESLFVLNEYRHTGAGARLISKAKEAGKEKGAIGLLISAPFGGVLASALSKRKGFIETNRVFFTRIE